MRLHKKWEPYMFLALPLLAYLAVVLVPIFSSISYSLMNWNGIGEKTFTGMDNYRKMLSDTTLRTCLLNTLKYALVDSFCQVGGGLLLAILVQRISKGRNLVKVLLFTPVVISGMAMSQTFKKLLGISPDGVVNALLGLLGLEKVAFLANMDLTLYVVAICEAFRFTGLYMVIFHAAFESIPEDILEAASLDGAGFWRSLLHVRLPLIKGIIINSVILALVGTLKAFEGPFVLTNGGPGYASELLSTYMYKTAFNRMDYGYGSALSILLVVICLTAFFLVNKLARRKEDDAK